MGGGKFSSLDSDHTEGDPMFHGKQGQQLLKTQQYRSSSTDEMQCSAWNNNLLIKGPSACDEHLLYSPTYQKTKTSRNGEKLGIP